LDTALLWILVAMFNLLRLRNGYGVRGLKIFCLSANLAALVMEVLRLKIVGPAPLTHGVAILILGETLFSIARKQ
jgi:hypothetical protein